MRNIPICRTFTCIGIWKKIEILTTFGSSGTKLLFPSWLLDFQHEERETHFLLSWLFHRTRQRAARPAGSNWTRLGSNLNCLFSKYPRTPARRFRAWRHSQSNFLSGVFIMTSVIVTFSLNEREHLRSMRAPTRALSQKVISLTKPKYKI